MQIVGEKDGLLRGLHAGTPGDGGLKRFVNPPVAVVAVRPGTALKFDVDAWVTRCFVHVADRLSCAPKNDGRPTIFHGQQVSDDFVFLKASDECVDNVLRASSSTCLGSADVRCSGTHHMLRPWQGCRFRAPRVRLKWSNGTKNLSELATFIFVEGAVTL